MKRLILLILLLTLAAGGYYYYRSLRQGPEYALLQAAAATQTHDLATFNKYVDVASIAGALADDAVSNSGALAGLVPGGGLALRGGLHFLKPQLAKAAQAEVARLVETGSLEQARATAPKRLVNVSLLGLLGRVVGPDSKFKGVKYSTDKGDGQALVGLEFTQPRYDTTMVVEVQLRRQPDGQWQAKRIANAPELLTRVARLEKQKLLP